MLRRPAFAEINSMRHVPVTELLFPAEMKSFAKYPAVPEILRA